MGNMREISVQECNAVFGGTDEELAEITVTATKRYYENSFSDNFWGSSGQGFGFSFATIADMFNFNLPDQHQITDEDVDGDGIPNWMEDPIIVDGDRSLPAGFVEVPGGYYMYHLASDGTRGPLEFTPWYAEQVCEIYDSHQQAIDSTSSMYGYVSAGIGFLGNPVGATAGTLMGFIADGTGANSPPQHCAIP